MGNSCAVEMPQLKASAEVPFQELPAWDAFDRHVLRFSGYFKATPRGRGGSRGGAHRSGGRGLP